MDRLATLNPSQREAVLTTSGPLLVLAGAGTGKTRVITFRIAELVRRGVPADRILSVTFTNKAAREMQQRTSELIGKRLKQKPWISTFHSLCVNVLRQDAPHLGYPATFSICDRGDQESAARTALREIRVGDKALRPADLLSQIGQWKSAGVDPDLAGDYVTNDREFLASVAYRRYQSNLRSRGAVDFDDLLLLTCRLFEENETALQRHQQRFDHVQIDEYQDTNSLQFRLIEALVEPHRCLCVVGDDDQSIYGWRGAEVDHILNFQHHFPGAKVVRLEDNYRCTDQILEIANRLVRHNRDRHKKTLIAHKKRGAEVRFLELPDETAEAEQVVRDIAYLSQVQGVPLNQFAILCRTNEQPRPFEAELRRKKLRYRLVGGQSFFDRREVRDILAYLKTIANPSDEESLLRIINVPARGIGQSSSEKVLEAAVRDGKSFWDAVPACGAAGSLNPRTVGALNTFHDLLERYRRRFSEENKQLDAVVSALLQEIDYEAEIRKQYTEPAQQEARLIVVDQIVDSVKEYLERASRPTLAGFLEDTALSDRSDEFGEEDKFDESAVTLMTLHSAKGLEFPRVYLVGLEEGILPHHRSIESSESAISEERRLAYVGITRAMDHLTITRAATRMKWGKRRTTLPSRFLAEMQREADVDAGDEPADHMV